MSILNKKFLTKQIHFIIFFRRVSSTVKSSSNVYLLSPDDPYSTPPVVLISILPHFHPSYNPLGRLYGHAEFVHQVPYYYLSLLVGKIHYFTVVSLLDDLIVSYLNSVLPVNLPTLLSCPFSITFRLEDHSSSPVFPSVSGERMNESLNTEVY